MPTLNGLVKELVRSNILVVNVPNGWERRPYRDLFQWLLWEKNLLPMGIYRKASARRGDMSYVFTSPPAEDVTLHGSDKVFCLVPTKPPSGKDEDTTRLGQRDPLEWFDRLVQYVNADRSRELETAFEMYINDDGLVAPKDFKAVLLSTGLTPSEAEVKAMVEGDGDGLEAASPDGIDFFEFNQRAGDVLEEGWDSPEDTIARTFKVIDANGEGNVDATEMRVAFASIIGIQIEESACEALIQQNDTTGSGQLDAEGWKRMVAPRMKKLAEGKV
jgi:Ca2+-binding EF-hand superfamily protein